MLSRHKRSSPEMAEVSTSSMVTEDTADADRFGSLGNSVLGFLFLAWC